MKDEIFGVLQRVGRSFMLPVAVLPIAGLLLGLGASFTNPTTIATYGLEGMFGPGTTLNMLLTIMSKTGGVIFGNLPLIFAVGVAIGMSQAEKEVAALAAMIAFFVMHTACNAMLEITGKIVNGAVAPDVIAGTIDYSCGILSLQMGVFGGIVVGIGVAILHNRFHKIILPDALSFFGGSRFIPIISTVVYMFVGIAMTFVWPVVQQGIFAIGDFVASAGYFGTFLFGIVKRSLIPFGLHHVFYLPFWQTAMGGSEMINGHLVQGAQNIIFAELADPNTVHFNTDYTRFFSGEFLFMMFGLPGAALAMYHCAKPENKKTAGGLLLSAALTSFLTGITEPIEFSFLFVAPVLFGVQVLLAATSYVVAQVLGIGIGLTFSAGLLDFTIFGILQGNDKTSWMLVIPCGLVYFALYYFSFRFLITKFNFKTPGREDEGQETKLYSKADYQAKKGGGAGGAAGGGGGADELNSAIARALGSKRNITSVDCCATRLRCSVVDSSVVDEALLKATGAVGVIIKGTGVQVIYGPKVAVIKADLEEYLANRAPDVESDGAAPTAEAGGAGGGAPVGEKIKLCSPMTGSVHPMCESPDAAFAMKAMGDGFFVQPAKGELVAPADGEVMMVFPTKHAIGFKSDDGVEFLFHVGVDTVKLNGQGFETFVTDGQKVKKGDILMKFDMDFVKKNAPSDAAMVILTAGQLVTMDKTGDVQALDEVATCQ